MSTFSSRRAAGLLLPVLPLLALFAAPANAGGTKHPYFDDRGTLTWYHSLAEAKAAARRQGKVIFVEFGRKKCTNCRKLAQDLLPHRNVRGRMGQAAVGLAAECDTPEREIVQLFRAHLPKARVLPFVAFITPEGRWITGWYGGSSVDRVSAHLASAERVLRNRRRSSVVTSAPQRPAARSRPSVRSAPVARPPRRAPAPASGTVPMLEDDGCNTGCVGGNCGVPSLAPPCLPNPLQLLAPRCKPKRCPPKPCPPKPCPPKAGPPVRATPRTTQKPACPPPCPTFQMDKPVASPQPKPPVVKTKKKPKEVAALWTTAVHTPTVADLARDAAIRLDYGETWSLFRSSLDLVDGRRDGAKTR